jgi:hypothetical protein
LVVGIVRPPGRRSYHAVNVASRKMLDVNAWLQRIRVSKLAADTIRISPDQRVRRVYLRITCSNVQHNAVGARWIS